MGYPAPPCSVEPLGLSIQDLVARGLLQDITGMQDMEQQSEAWFAARKGRLTASNVGAVLGLSPHATRADVMRRMVREWHGAESEFTGNIATEYGNRNEPGALVEYQMETGHAVKPMGFVTFEDWAGCSPDGLIGDDGGLEIKCPFGKRNGGEFKTLEDQPHYYAQIQFSMVCTGRDWWHFYQWQPEKTAMETVLQDAEWQAVNMPLLRQFHAEYLNERLPKNAGPHFEARRVVIDTLSAHKMATEYDELTEAIQNAEARKKELLADMVAMAGAKSAVFAGRNLTQVQKQGAVSYAKALAKYAPKADLEPFRGAPSNYWLFK